MTVMEKKGTDTIRLTEAAVSMVQTLLDQKEVPNHGLRVFVSGGGCSGMQYGMALEAEPGPYDNVVEQGGIKLFIDPTSMMYLSGATVDYADNLMGGGFSIDNPNAVSTCGCGHSFKTSGQGQQGAGQHGAGPQGAAAGAAGGGCGCG